MATLKELRLSKGYTLREVSEDLGISLSALCKYERGASPISDRMYYILCEYYGVSEFENKSNKYIELTNQNNNLKYELENKIFELEEENKSLKKENKELENKYRVIIKEKDSYIKNLESQILNFNNRARRLASVINHQTYQNRRDRRNK